MYDVLIIGAGITGAGIAMELSKYRLKIGWLEQHNDVAIETTRANSGIIHSGYDPKPGTKMARLNVRGAALYKALAPLLNIHYQIVGSLVIGRNEKDQQVLKDLYDRGIANGVEQLSLLDGEQVHALEPNLREDISCGLLSPTAAIISPWEACLAFAQTAVHNGVELFLQHGVQAIEPMDGGYRVTAGERTFEARYVINCAGVRADDVYRLLSPKDAFTIAPVKGQYYLLDKTQGQLVNRVIFQPPNELGKGVLVSRTAHGNLIAGPDAQKNIQDKSDVSVAADNLAFIRQAAALTTDKINYRENIRNFSGLRAKLVGREDFLIAESEEYPGFFNFAGIQSPGLSCGPAFGEEAAVLLQNAGLKLDAKEIYEYLPLPKAFREMTPDEANEIIEKDPRYGKIVCRCETITEGEIISTIHRPIGATTIDGVKRRTNAGMGRCQGGFCGPKVLEILHRELGYAPTEVLQDQPGSYIIAEIKGNHQPDKLEFALQIPI